MKIKDHGKREFTFGLLTLRACDCDEENNIENIDVIYKGKLLYCININDDNDHARVLRDVFDMLTPGD